MIRAIKYVYWYIMAMIAYFLSRKDLKSKMRWQYYCWMTASRKSKPKTLKMEGESGNDDQGSGE